MERYDKRISLFLCSLPFCASPSLQEDVGRLPRSIHLTPADVKEQNIGQSREGNGTEDLKEEKRPAAGPNPDPGRSQSCGQRHQPDWQAGHSLSTDGKQLLQPINHEGSIKRR